VAVALLDGQGRCVTGSGFQKYEAVLEGKQPAQGIYPMEDGTCVYVSKPIQDGFALAAAVSGEALKQQVSEAFVHSYLSLLVLSLVGIALVYVAMCFTYRPLHRLVRNLGHETGRHQNYLEMISRNHSELISQKMQLEDTLAQYRQSLALYRERRAYPHEALGKLSDHLEKKRFSAPLAYQKNIKGSTMHIELETPTLISEIVLSENLLADTLIDSFQVDAELYGKPFSLYRGLTIGHKHICHFPPLTVKTLVFTFHGGMPDEIEIY